MRSFLLSSALFLVLLPTLLYSQAQLSMKIHLPDVQVNVTTESYEPNPLPVTATIFNTGSVASDSLTARISLVTGLALDSSEHSVMIKRPAPAVVPPGDSATVVWQIVVPPAFSIKNYRVYVWLKYGANDSLSTNYLFTVPAMTAPDLVMTPTGLADLAVRPDSLGYQGNPFAVNFRFTNAGGTTADSVSVLLELPPDYELDPSTQANPKVFPGLMKPQAAGGPRYYENWTVRYTGATRARRTDTLRLHARAKDIAGQLVTSETELSLNVDGMHPVLDISFMDPGMLQFDSAKIYSPQPYPLVVRLLNNSEQWTALKDVEFALMGVGIDTQDPLTRTLPALSPGSHLDLTWRVDVERRNFSRQFVGQIAVRDIELYETGAQRIIGVPGQPYALTVQDAVVPDALALNAAGTNLISRDIPLSFRLLNETWYNNTVVQVRVQSMGQGIDAPPFRDHQPMFALLPGAKSPALPDTFTVQPALKDRIVSFSLLAYTDRGDSAQAIFPVRIPGVMPVFSLTRRGPEKLEYQPGGTYTPNPFSQEYTLRNEGHVAVRVDSIVLRYPMDGVTPAQPLRRDIGWMLQPGDSLQTRWDFTVYVRDTLRRIPMQVTAYMSEEYAAAVGHTLEIPALFPILNTSVRGPDTLSYDPSTAYVPNPFTKTLFLVNNGTADLPVDSVTFDFTDALVTLRTPRTWSDGRVLKADSAMSLTWTMQAAERDTEIQLPMTFTIHHEAGKKTVAQTSIYIPALRPGLEATILGNAQLLTDEENIYRPDPFTKTVRIYNSGTADLVIDSIAVSFTDPGLQLVEEPLRVINAVVSAGKELLEDWNFNTAAHASSGYVSINFILYHSGGESLPLRSEIYIPGEPFAFSLADVNLPDRLTARADGQGYENNPVVVPYVAHNDAWFATTLTRVHVEIEGEGVQMLTPQPWIPAITLSAYEKSTVLKDSFFVFPAQVDRTIRVRISIDGSRGLGDSKEFLLFVPRIVSTAAEALNAPADFAIEALYPNPVSSAKGGMLFVSIRSNTRFQWDVVDMLGRRIRSSVTEEAAPETVIRRVVLDGLRQGSYLLRVRSGTQVLTRSFLIID